jgi:hypothetical protein
MYLGTSVKEDECTRAERALGITYLGALLSKQGCLLITEELCIQ